MECLICMLSDKPTQSCPTCSKHFHTSCLYQWGKQICPHCSQPFEFFSLLNLPTVVSKNILASSGMMKKMILPISYPYLHQVQDVLKLLQRSEFYEKLESLLPESEAKTFLRNHPHEWRRSTLYEYATRLSKDLKSGELHVHHSMVISSFFEDFYNKCAYGIYKDHFRLFDTFARLNIG
jgi:hypothetical protein